MARRQIRSLADDFDDVIKFLMDRGTIRAASQSLTNNARKIHSATYSLILWRFRLRRLPEHGKVFIHEIASDALQILPQVLMGYGKTATLLTRGIIENTLRHIYFSDHPIEFERMNRDKKWFLTMDHLFDYVKNHPAFLETELKFDGLNKASTLYSELSGDVHGRTVGHLEMRTALNAIVYTDDLAQKHATNIERCASTCNFLLAVFQRDQMSKLTTEDQRNTSLNASESP